MYALERFQIGQQIVPLLRGEFLSGHASDAVADYLAQVFLGEVLAVDQSGTLEQSTQPRAARGVNLIGPVAGGALLLEERAAPGNGQAPPAAKERRSRKQNQEENSDRARGA